MRTTLKKLSPYFLIFLGLILLLIIDQPGAAGACILTGIVMLIEKIWPERWETDKRKIDIEK